MSQRIKASREALEQAFHKVTESDLSACGAARSGGGYATNPEQPNPETSRDDTIDGEYYEQP